MLLLLASSVLLAGPWQAGGQEPAADEGLTDLGALVQKESRSSTPPAQGAPDSPARNLDTLFDGALVGAKDGEDFAETPGYRRMLELLSSYGEAELQQKATRWLDVPDAVAHPDLWRGEFVRLRPLLAKLQTVRLGRPLGEHVDVYRAFVINDRGQNDSEGMVVDFLAEPPELEARTDVLDVEAVFFRTLRFENVKGESVEAPYLIARSVRRFQQEDAPRNTTLDGVAAAMIGAAVVFLVARILWSMRDGNKRPDSAFSSRAIRDRAHSAHRSPSPAKNPQKSV